VVTDIVRTYSDSFDSISSHVSGVNNSGLGSFYMSDQTNGGANAILIDGSGKWRDCKQLGVEGSAGFGVCNLMVYDNTKLWW
jgi:hypothetical protein